VVDAPRLAADHGPVEFLGAGKVDDGHGVLLDLEC
jgi:hypothetical protein